MNASQWITLTISIVAALTGLVNGILKIATTSKVTKFEYAIMTDSKKVSNTFINGSVAVIFLTALSTSILTFVNPSVKVEFVIVFVIFSSLLYASIVFCAYNIYMLVKKKKVLYYVENIYNEAKLYIHKSISEQELILSRDAYFNDQSSDFLIVKREDLYRIMIKKESVKK